jgi:cytochrome c
MGLSTRRRLWIATIAGAAALAALIGAEAAQWLIDQRTTLEKARAMTGGEPNRAADAMRRLGCFSCHDIPGIAGAQGRVGPPLTHMASRAYIAGVMPNTAENLILWIRWPQGILPNSGMPNMGASEAESRDIAAYLLSLQ